MMHKVILSRQSLADAEASHCRKEDLARKDFWQRSLRIYFRWLQLCHSMPDVAWHYLNKNFGVAKAAHATQSLAAIKDTN